MISLLLLAISDAILGPRERVFSVWHVLQRAFGQPLQGDQSWLAELSGPWAEAFLVLGLVWGLAAAGAGFLKRRGLIGPS